MLLFWSWLLLHCNIYFLDLLYDTKSVVSRFYWFLIWVFLEMKLEACRDDLLHVNSKVHSWSYRRITWLSDNEYHSYEVIAAAVLKLPFSNAVCGMLFVDSDTDLLGLNEWWWWCACACDRLHSHRLSIKMVILLSPSGNVGTLMRFLHWEIHAGSAEVWFWIQVSALLCCWLEVWSTMLRQRRHHLECHRLCSVTAMALLLWSVSSQNIGWVVGLLSRTPRF